MKKWTVVFLCLLMLFPAGVYLFAARTSGDEEGMRGAEEFFKARENTNPPAARSDGGKHRIAYVAVSYTHLDVYKRQPTSLSGSTMCPLGSM